MAKSTKDLLAILSDKPTKNDLLGFRDYSSLLTNLILDSETPSTIGIFGDWGSGKTSLMLMIDEVLRNKKLETIWFNAWKYDKEDALWRALILSILENLNEDQKVIDEKTRRLYTAISEDKAGKLEIDWMEAGKFLTKLVLFVLSPLLILPGLVSDIDNLGLLDQISKSFARKAIRQSQEKISSIEEFEKLYKSVLTEYFQRQKSKQKRIVIFIDDLDRCQPIHSLEILEALKSFLDVEGCIYVIACDTRLINQGLREKYGEKSGVGMDDYLGKIIQFSFSIPPIHPEDAERFIKGLGLVVDSADMVRLISTTLERNPRKLKRFLNDLKIKSQLIEARGLDIKSETLTKMSCVTFVWKEFWQASLKDISVFTRAQNIARSAKDVEKSPDDIEFEKIFYIDQRLQEFLRFPPLVTDADLHEYIFLSTTTTVNTVSQNSIKDVVRGTSATSTSLLTKNEMLAGGKQIVILNSIIEAIRKRTPVISLTGAPGIGKTTLLRILENIESNDFVTVYTRVYGFVNYITSDKSSGEWLIELARQISQELKDKGFQIKLKSDDGFLNFSRFLDDVILEIKNKQLVIILDEFDGLPVSEIDRFTTQLAEVLNPAFLAKHNLTIILCGRDLSNLSILASDAELSINLSEIYRRDFELEYEGLVSLPISEYDLGAAYRLLFLFENELRRLISLQFTKLDWWQHGLPNSFYEKVLPRLKKDETIAERLDLFTLGELFKIILDSKNWEHIFMDIFVDKENLSSQSQLIIRARNSIAHSRALLPIEMERFVLILKEQLQVIHAQNLKG